MRNLKHLSKQLKEITSFLILIICLPLEQEPSENREEEEDVAVE